MAVRDRCLQPQNEYDSRIATLHMDGGAEFQPTELGKWSVPAGIRVELSAPYIPEENPVAETPNRIVFTKARAVCSQGRYDTEGSSSNRIYCMAVPLIPRF